MKPTKRILNYVNENFNEVMHTTLDPEGPGVVRIHLVPPTVKDGNVEASVAIINGQDVIPVNISWAILLSEFIKQVNKYEGHEVSYEDSENIIKETIRNVRRVYPFLSKKIIKNDIDCIMQTFTDVAYGRVPQQEILYMTLGEYAPYMRAPHRMDLLVSAMEKDGNWHCNQKCIHCYAAGQKLVSEEELSTEDWKKIIDKCKESCIPQITFTGGEPTMREDLIELIDYSRWFVTRLNTNGIKLTRDFCEKLKAASLDSCQITFYSSEEEVHNKLVGANQFRNTVAGIDNAIESGLNISINTPLCTLNRNYINTLEFLRDRGVRYVTCSGLITTGNALGEESSSLQLDSEELKTILQFAVDFCKENGMEMSFTSPGWIEKAFFEKLGMNMPTCGACLSNMAITPGGNVVPCQSYLSAEPLGSMLNDKWEDIWESKACLIRRDFSADMSGECPLRRVSK